MTTKENLPSVWVVNAIGGSVYHVMTLAEDEGASEMALCRKIIPLKQRAGPAHWRSQLKGYECCQRCLILSGHGEDERKARNRRTRKAAVQRQWDFWDLMTYLRMPDLWAEIWPDARRRRDLELERIENWLPKRGRRRKCP